MKIRLLKKSDIKQASAIVGKNYSKKWEKVVASELLEMFGESVMRPNYIVAEEKGTVLGFAGYMQSWMDYEIYLIFWVNVIPEKHKQGVGKKLVAETIRRIKSKKSARLILLTATPPNARYYKQKFGFQSLQTFSKGDHLMSLKLN